MRLHTQHRLHCTTLSTIHTHTHTHAPHACMHNRGPTAAAADTHTRAFTSRNTGFAFHCRFIALHCTCTRIGVYHICLYANTKAHSDLPFTHSHVLTAYESGVCGCVYSVFVCRSFSRSHSALCRLRSCALTASVVSVSHSRFHYFHYTTPLHLHCTARMNAVATATATRMCMSGKQLLLFIAISLHRHFSRSRFVRVCNLLLFACTHDHHCSVVLSGNK